MRISVGSICVNIHIDAITMIYTCFFDKVYEICVLLNEFEVRIWYNAGCVCWLVVCDRSAQIFRYGANWDVGCTVVDEGLDGIAVRVF